MTTELNKQRVSSKKEVHSEGDLCVLVVLPGIVSLSKRIYDNKLPQILSKFNKSWGRLKRMHVGLSCGAVNKLFYKNVAIYCDEYTWKSLV